MIPIEQLLAAGVHFGHRVNKWNPKMAPYIFGERNGVHIIDLIQTLGYLENAYQFLATYKIPQGSSSNSGVSLGKKVLFVGTKKQVAPIIQKEAENCLANYVNHRWLGGLLTNWTTIQSCVAKLHKLENTPKVSSSLPVSTELNPEIGESIPQKTSISFENDPSITKKEKAILKKQYEKLKKFFGGIQNMSEIPEIVIIVGQDCEMNAVRECHKLCETSYQRLSSENKFNENSKRSEGRRRNTFTPLPRTITILDTNSDPSLADIFIPANDDSTKSVELILGKLSEAIQNSR